ncbi:MAG: F0F1 ATP synthase subunit B [Planctomycetaceae bacterium]|nr:F0F1 ATP synthase subunit B [Planctomycetaceae bacterium]
MALKLGTITGMLAAMALAGACLAADAPHSEASGDQEPAPQFTPGDLGQSIASLLIFGGLMAVLGKYAWKPIVKQLQTREELIAQRVRRAEEAKVNAELFLETSRAQIEQARNEAHALVVQARKESEDIRDCLLQQARDEADTVAENARRDVEAARREAAAGLQVATAELAGEIAAEALKRQLDPQQQQRLVEESLKIIRSAAGES